MKRGRRLRSPIFVAVLAVVAPVAIMVTAQPASAAPGFEVAALDGSNNNTANPTLGKAGTPYIRVAPVRYADGIGTPVAGPNSRFISNRVFQDLSQDVLSERRVTHWGNVWGQFIDHTFGLAQGGGPAANIPFNSSDPLEQFTDTLGVIPFNRNAVAPGTGVNTPRQQVNTENSFIDAEDVYGHDATREEWLRDGSINGNPTDNAATLMLPGGYLPQADARGDPSSAPAMDVDGRLLGAPNTKRIAGDPRANENIDLTATQTLFAREHNRIVSLLPASLSAEDKFQIARRVVVAEQQYVTYNEFLPAMGVSLPAYTGYKSTVNPTLSTEFATVGYRGHSQIHGNIEIEADTSRYSTADLDFFRAQGVDVLVDGAEVTLTVPLGVAFFNPALVNRVGLGPMLEGIGGESEYRNDEMIDNQLRSVLFQVPVSGNPQCLDGPTLPQCFSGVTDLAAIDIERDRDHGIGSYNQLRVAYGLPAVTSFTQITGEASSAFPVDPLLTRGNEINDPNSIDFTSLSDIDGQPLALGSDTAAKATRRTPLAARLQAIYGSVDNVDAFVGMLAEPHVTGTEFGPLQLAIWTKQFLALRDGDRFFYGNDQGLSLIQQQYGIDFHRTLAQIIASDSDIPAADLSSNVFLVKDDDLPATSCTVSYTLSTQWPGGYQVAARITNTGTQPVNGWSLKFSLYSGQQVTDLWNGVRSQSGKDITATNASYNATIAPGGTVDIGFNATWDNATNSRPQGFFVNGNRCALG